MEQTIDKKVIEVLKKEVQKLSKNQKSAIQVVKDIERITGTQSENYTIAPLDTIGKTILYNVRRV